MRRPTIVVVLPLRGPASVLVVAETAEEQAAIRDVILRRPDLVAEVVVAPAASWSCSTRRPRRTRRERSQEPRRRLAGRGRGLRSRHDREDGRLGADALDERAGVCYPGRQAIAARASLSDRAVDAALRRLEAAGWVAIGWSDGGRGRTNFYRALLPETANEVRRSEWEKANLTTQKGERRSVKGEGASPEDVRRRLKAAAPSASALSGAPAEPRERGEFAPVDDCQGCGVRAALVAPRFHYCAACQERIDLVAAEGAK